MWPLKFFSGCLLLTLALATAAHAQNFATNVTVPSLKLRSREQHLFPAKGDNVLLHADGQIPLGSDSILLASDGQRAAIMASLESPQLGAITVFEHKHIRFVVDGQGEPVRRLPAHLTFRITASSLVRLAEKPYKIEVNAPIETFLKGLKFRARISHPGELVSTMLQPSSVQVVGVPLDIASAERVYRANFDVGPLSVSDHVVLEVSSAEGTPVSKFILQLK